MPEANFGPEVQPTTPEAQVFRGSPNVVVSRGSMLDRITSAVVGKAHDVKDNLKPYVLHVVTATALLAAACSGGDQNNDIRIDTQTPTPTAEATLESPPSPTSEPTLAPSNGGGSDGKFPTPTATSTPEVKQEVPCVIVPQEYCSQAELLTVKGYEKDGYIIGINVPPDTQISAPIDGLVLKSDIEAGRPYKGQQVLIKDQATGKAFTIIGDMPFNGDMASSNVVKGKPVVKVGNGNLNNFGYKVIIIVNGSPEEINTAFKLLFPRAFEKPPKEVVLPVASSQSGSVNGGVVYEGKKR